MKKCGAECGIDNDDLLFKAVQRLIQRFALMLVVVQIEQKEIVAWIE